MNQNQTKLVISGEPRTVGFGCIPKEYNIPYPEYAGQEVHVTAGGSGVAGVYWGFDPREKAVLLKPSIVYIDDHGKKAILNEDIPTKLSLPITCMRPYPEGTLVRMIEDANNQEMAKKQE